MLIAGLRRLQTFPETAHGFREPRLFDRLQQVIECALRKRLHGVVIVGRDEHEMRAPADVVRGIDAGESRHVDVEEADVGMTLVEQPHRLPSVPRLGHNLELGPHDRQLAPQRIAQQRFIVRDQRGRVGVHVCAGMSISTTAPRGPLGVRRRCAASPKISCSRSRRVVSPVPRPFAD